jgi:phospholipase/lecithinase/hemolysin
MSKFPLLSFCLALSLLLAAPVFAVDFSNFKHLVVFGDSLSDDGNYSSLVLPYLKETLPSPPPYAPPPPYGVTFDGSGLKFPGRFTDGQNWVDYFPCVASRFDSITPFYADPINGTNVAVGGSTSANLLQSGPNGFPPAQILDYVESKPGHRVSRDDLYVIWIGANDLSAGITNPRTTVDNIRKAIGALANAGAKDFIVIDVPDISLTPDVKALGPAKVHEARQFVAAVNLLLAIEIPLSAWRERVNIHLVDINTIFVPLVMCPALFGFSNSIGAAFDPAKGTIVSDPNAYVFWDGFHPTTNVHFIAAEFIYRLASRGFDFSVISSR